MVAFALFMQQLDATVLGIALPAMSREFGVAAEALSLALTSYLVALAVLIPASGWAADRWGSRSVFCGAMAAFVVGSIACAASSSLLQLVLARLLQGGGGAMMMPVGRLALVRSVPRERLAAALSWLVIPALIGPILGPPVGGLIVTYLDWRWIFLINVPFGIVGAVLASFLLPQVRAERTTAFDWIGFALAGSALSSIVFGLELFSHALPPAYPGALLLVGAGLAIIYLRHARRRSRAVLDLGLFATDTFRLSVIPGSLIRCTQGAQPFLLPLMFQLGFGFTAATTGAILAATAFGALAMKPFAPALLDRFGYRSGLTVAGTIASLGYASCAAFRPDWPLPLMIALLVISGAAMSFLLTGYNALAFFDIAPDRISAATSLYGTCQQLSLSLGICLAGGALAFMQRFGGQEAHYLVPFSGAFLALTAVSASSVIWNRRLSPETER